MQLLQNTTETHITRKKRHAQTGERESSLPFIGMTGLLIIVTAIGCGSNSKETARTAAPPVMPADDSTTYQITPSELRANLKANERAKFTLAGNSIVRAELFQSGIRSIEPLRGIPLEFLDLGMTDVSDISPLEGMPLKELVLENTPVADISVLKGMQLEVVKLQNTKITDLTVLHGMPIRQLNLLGLEVNDLSPFHDMPLETLWAPRTKIADLSPLAGMKLQSLDIQATDVRSLEPLAAMTTLRRLNIADTPVTDLTPLKDLKLERLTFSPERITAGIDVIRNMPSLAELQPTVETPIKAADFWQRYDLGVWQPVTELLPSENSDAAGNSSADSPKESPPGNEENTRTPEEK
ncbi:MAG: hypothetical protein KDA91_04025 [Planctomycetaceae bacterium]|nr:hypothetical protein [Planctomycetaceae bacterium]